MFKLSKFPQALTFCEPNTINGRVFREVSDTQIVKQKFPPHFASDYLTPFMRYLMAFIIKTWSLSVVQWGLSECRFKKKITIVNFARTWKFLVILWFCNFDLSSGTSVDNLPQQDLPDHPLLQQTATADVRALGTLLHILLHRGIRFETPRKVGSLLPRLREDLSAGEHGYFTLYRGQLLVTGLDTASRVHK